MENFKFDFCKWYNDDNDEPYILAFIPHLSHIYATATTQNISNHPTALLPFPTQLYSIAFVQNIHVSN